MHKNANKFVILGLIPFLVLLPIAFYFRDFLIYVISRNTVLNSIIICSALVTVAITIWRIAQYNREFRSVQLFEKGVRAGRDMNSMLALPAVRSSEMAQVFSRLSDTDGRVRHGVDQNAIESEFELVKETYEARQEFTQHMTGVMVAFGLLGTFIGLLGTLVKVSDLLAGFANADLSSMGAAIKELIDKLRSPLSSMGTAFSTSMFGLVFSLMLGMMSLILRSAYGSFFSYAHKVLRKLSRIAVETANKESAATITADGSDSTLASLVKHFGLPMSYTKTLGEQMSKLNKVLDMQQKMIARQTQANVGMNRALSWITDEDRKRAIDMNLPVDQMRQAIKSLMGEVKALFKKQQEGMDGPALLCGMSVIESILKSQRLLQYMINRIDHFPGINAEAMHSFYKSLTSHRDIMLMLVDRVRTAETDDNMPLDEKEAIKEDFLQAVDRVNQQIQFDSSRIIPDITAVLSNYSDVPVDVSAKQVSDEGLLGRHQLGT